MLLSECTLQKCKARPSLRLRGYRILSVTSAVLFVPPRETNTYFPEPERRAAKSALRTSPHPPLPLMAFSQISQMEAVPTYS